LLRNARQQTFTVELGDPAAKLWIGGEPVANGQRVKLANGNYLFALQTELRPESQPFRVILWSAQREPLLARMRPYLERAAR
jgi:hypothetical protein